MIKKEIICKQCGNMFSTKASRLRFNRGFYCSVKCRNLSFRGIRISDYQRKKIAESNRSREYSFETRKRMSESHIGNKAYNWGGGWYDSFQIWFRKTFEYRLWRRKVFERDNYTCIVCGKRGVFLEADHIKPFVDYPELRLDIGNGRTLCRGCHKETDTWGSKYRWSKIRPVLSLAKRK